jgi:hypothetical protein
MVTSVFGLTRRDLFKSATVLVSAEGFLLTNTAHVQAETDAGSVALDLRRPHDLLVLKFVFSNAVLRARDSSYPYVVRGHKSQAIIVSIYFPSQHVDEEAFLETVAKEPPGPIPVWSRASGMTRLCFEIPDRVLWLRSEHLLDWERWVGGKALSGLRLVELHMNLNSPPSTSMGARHIFPRHLFAFRRSILRPERQMPGYLRT